MEETNRASPETPITLTTILLHFSHGLTISSDQPGMPSVPALTSQGLGLQASIVTLGLEHLLLRERVPKPSSQKTEISGWATCSPITQHLSTLPLPGAISRVQGLG